jgi:hypothetical protein
MEESQRFWFAWLSVHPSRTSVRTTWRGWRCEGGLGRVRGHLRSGRGDSPGIW